MNETTGELVEEAVANAFKESGWEIKAVQTPCDSFRPDFEIFSEGKSYGYVEAYSTSDPKVLLRKIDKIKEWLSTLERKPLLLILSDGFELHFSERGGSFEMHRFVPGPSNYPVLVSLADSYVSSLSDGKEKK